MYKFLVQPSFSGSWSLLHSLHDDRQANSWIRTCLVSVPGFAGLKKATGNVANSSLVLTIHPSTWGWKTIVWKVWSFCLKLVHSAFFNKILRPNHLAKSAVLVASPRCRCFFLPRKFVPGGRSYMTNQEWCELGAQDGFHSWNSELLIGSPTGLRAAQINWHVLLFWNYNFPEWKRLKWNISKVWMPFQSLVLWFCGWIWIPLYLKSFECLNDGKIHTIVELQHPAVCIIQKHNETVRIPRFFQATFWVLRGMQRFGWGFVWTTNWMCGRRWWTGISTGEKVIHWTTQSPNPSNPSNSAVSLSPTHFLPPCVFFFFRLFLSFFRLFIFCSYIEMVCKRWKCCCFWQDELWDIMYCDSIHPHGLPEAHFIAASQIHDIEDQGREPLDDGMRLMKPQPRVLGSVEEDEFWRRKVCFIFVWVSKWYSSIVYGFSSTSKRASVRTLPQLKALVTFCLFGRSEIHTWCALLMLCAWIILCCPQVWRETDWGWRMKNVRSYEFGVEI